MHGHYNINVRNERSDICSSSGTQSAQKVSIKFAALTSLMSKVTFGRKLGVFVIIYRMIKGMMRLSGLQLRVVTTAPRARSYTSAPFYRRIQHNLCNSRTLIC